jgi:hypothetical protein
MESSARMKTATAVHRDYFIDLEQGAQGWRVVAIKHSRTDRKLLSPAFGWSDRAILEKLTRAAIDQQLSPRRR